MAMKRYSSFINLIYQIISRLISDIPVLKPIADEQCNTGAIAARVV
jgi:hypothetical protein